MHIILYNYCTLHWIVCFITTQGVNIPRGWRQSGICTPRVVINTLFNEECAIIVTGFEKTLRMGSTRNSRNTQFAQCAFLVPGVKNCQSPDFVISMSNNPSSNCYRRLRRLVVSYKSEISLYFDLPSLYSCRTRSPLLRTLIRIPARGLSRHS